MQCNDECCIVYENIRNAAELHNVQHGNNLKAHDRKLKLSVDKSSPVPLRKLKSDVPRRKKIEDAKKSDSKQNTRNIGVQTDSDHGFVHSSVKLCIVDASSQTAGSGTVAHTVNSCGPQSERRECHTVFRLQKPRETGGCLAENYMTPNGRVETDKEDCTASKPKTYEEAMHIVKAFEKQVASTCDNLDMEEETLDFQPPYLHELGFSKPKGLSKDDKKNLISQGICIRSGRWSKSEDKILKRNWDNFVNKYNIDNPAFLLGLYRGCGKKATEIITYRHVKKFRLQLAKDLNDRTLDSICSRAKNMLDRWNYKGRFSAEERGELFHLQCLMGNQWSKIAILMNRRGQTCNNVYRRYKRKPSRGAWSKKEEEFLMKAVRRCVAGKNLRVKFHGYPWAKIASFVPKRNEYQCRAHWLTSLCWKYTYGKHHKWSKRNDALLIHVMYVDMVEDQSFIDWDYLHKIFKDSAPSHVFLQDRWCKLKCKVPNFAKKDHESIVLYLYRNYLPKVLRELHISEHDLECLQK